MQKKAMKKALEITDKWLSRDTENVVQEILAKINKHKGFQRFMRKFQDVPTVFIGEVKNLTSEPYFPINDINDEFLTEISSTGEFTLVDEAAEKEFWMKSLSE